MQINKNERPRNTRIWWNGPTSSANTATYWKWIWAINGQWIRVTKWIWISNWRVWVWPGESASFLVRINSLLTGAFRAGSRGISSRSFSNSRDWIWNANSKFNWVWRARFRRLAFLLRIVSIWWWRVRTAVRRGRLRIRAIISLTLRESSSVGRRIRAIICPSIQRKASCPSPVELVFRKRRRV